MSTLAYMKNISVQFLQDLIAHLYGNRGCLNSKLLQISWFLTRILEKLKFFHHNFDIPFSLVTSNTVQDINTKVENINALHLNILQNRFLNNVFPTHNAPDT